LASEFGIEIGFSSQLAQELPIYAKAIPGLLTIAKFKVDLPDPLSATVRP